MLTGCRRAEVFNARWSEIDAAEMLWRLPRERTKNATPHAVPLAPQAWAIVAVQPRFASCDFIFTNDGRRPIGGFQPAEIRSRSADAAGPTLGPARRSPDCGVGNAAARYAGRGDRAGAQPPIWHVSRDRRRLPATRLHRRAPYRPAALGGFRRAARIRPEARHRRADARAAAVKAVQQSIKRGKASKPRVSASRKNAVSWILLKDALALIADAYQNSKLAQRILCKAFIELQVRTRAARAECGWIRREHEPWKEYEHNLQLGDLWRREYFGPDGSPYAGRRIIWQDSSATVLTGHPGPVTFFRIEVAQEDLKKLLPPGYKPASPSALKLASSFPRSGLKRGPKGFDPSQLKRFEIKFYEMLYANDVSADTKIAVDAYASELIGWGERNDLYTPQRFKMSEEIKKWLLQWIDFKALKL